MAKAVGTLEAAASGVVALLALICGLQPVLGATSTTSLQFYMHDNFNIAPDTVVQVAGARNGLNASFGAMMVIDDPLTEGPLLTSKPVGRGQGTYMMSALDGSSLLLTFTAVFSSSGDTLSFHGADRIFLAQREIAVIGGTGKYRKARGYAVMQTVSNTNKSTILGFNVTLLV